MAPIILNLLTTLGAILLHAPTMTSGLHRGGAHPVSQEVIQEARALNARYRHLATQQDTYYRIHRQHGNRTRQTRQRQRIRGLQQHHPEESFQWQVLEDHLFRPLQPEADNEQSGTKDTTANTVSLRQVGLEGSAKPLFFCSPCKAQSHKEEEDCARCKGFVFSQQEHIQTAVKELFPEARIVATTTKLVNMVFVEMAIAPHDDIAEMDHALSQISGVLRIRPQEDSTLEDTNATAYMGGGAPLEERFCGVGGKGVKIAILDSGVDYTHQRIGGPGTTEAYQLAYGTGPESPENKQRNPELFPTETVIDGKDFLGESFVHTAESVVSDALPDDNPIDHNRHGTMVADAILSVAPQTQLIACKVCTSDTGTCPGFAVLQALEYALDPNGDGNTDDKVDIVNLSLGGSYLSSYYDMRTEALEKVFQLGVLPVVAAGNEGNIPYIGGPGAKTPNALAVAATSRWNSDSYSIVASYSSRGPGDENNLKPDISAPSGLTLAAFGSGTEFFNAVEGTSFAAPLAAGSVALIKERCPSCSPFALKAILMNNAKRHVQYYKANTRISQKQSTGNSQNATEVDDRPDDDAPNSLVGAGEILLQKALDSDVWAYCVEDTQPSVSFGLINAHQEMILKKTIKVINLSGLEQTLSIRNEFSSKLMAEEQENPMIVSFSPELQVLPAGCNTEITFEVTLMVDASKAPANRMTSGGQASNDPSLNDWNEFGGWIVIENEDTAKDVSLAYYALIRQASNLKIESSGVIDNFNGGPTQVEVKLANRGAGVAQVDAYELLFTSEDDPEGGYGEEITPSDFKYLGYRVVEPQGQAGTCDYLLEFSFTTWEKQKRINLEFFQVHIDIDLDGGIDYIVFNSGVFTPFTENVGCIVRNKNTGEISCTGFSPDHSTNTGNTILRVCSNDIGFTDPPKQQQQINVYILTATATHLGVTEVTDRASENFHTLEFPQTWISAPSYDIYPGETLDLIEIDGTGGNDRVKPLGLILVSNSYRGPDKTGAATAESETLILTNGQQYLPVEVTPDELAFPVAAAFDGPVCAAWENTGTCATARSGVAIGGGPLGTKHVSTEQHVYRMHREESSESLLSDEGGGDIETRGAFDSVLFDTRADEDDKCPEIQVPRSQVLRVPGSELAQTTSDKNVTAAPGSTLANVTTPPGNSTSGQSSTPPANTSLTLQPTMAPSASPVAATLPPSQFPTVIVQPPSPLPTSVNISQTPVPTPVTSTARPTGPVTAAVVMYDAPQGTIEEPPTLHFFTSGAMLAPLGLGLAIFALFPLFGWLG